MGCFHPGGGGSTSISDTDTEDEGSTGDGPTSTDQPTTTSISESQEPTTPTTTAPTSSPSEPSTGSDAECGNGEVEAGEECDDGVNDGSYGGCAEDCSALGPFCGDSEINGPEVCDDGTNDNGYGGCAGDCAALGPYCGDGTVQEANEGCDEGDANEDGHGCNVDCIVSGTFLLEYESASVGSCKSSVTPPVFREDDSPLVAARGYCDNGRQAMIETTSELEEVAFTEYLFPSFPYHSTMRGADWLLATYGCTYLVDTDLGVTEVCDDTRISGNQGIDGVDDEVYVALEDDTIAQYPSTSPAIGDTPDWTATANPDSPPYTYSFYDVSPAALDTTLGAGSYSYYNGSSTTYYGYIHRFSSAGNSVDQNTYSSLTAIYNVQADDAGAVYAQGSGPAGDLMKLNGNLNEQWTIYACGADNIYINDFVLDHAGNLVVECSDYPNVFLRKLDSDSNELWRMDLEFEFDPTYGRLGVDSTDHIVRASIVHDNTAQEDRVRLEKYAP